MSSMNPMAVVSLVVSVFFLPILCLNASIVAQGETIIARTGDNVTLTCFGPGSVRVAEWYVNGDHQRYVYSWRGGDRPDVENQLQQYVGRVSVKNLEEEKKKKNGNNTDVSLTINNVRLSDSGTYECHVSNGTVDHSVTDTSYGTKSLRDTTLLVVDEVITVCPGDDVPLACDLPATVDAEGPVCSCVRDRQPDVSVDCRMSHGNISLVKKNLKPDDSGVYACSATRSVKKTVYYVDVSGHTAGREEAEEEEEEGGRGRKKRGCEGTTEDDHSHTDRSQLGLILGLVLVTVAAGLVLAPAGYWLYKNRCRQNSNNDDDNDPANEIIAL